MIAMNRITQRQTRCPARPHRCGVCGEEFPKDDCYHLTLLDGPPTVCCEACTDDLVLNANEVKQEPESATWHWSVLSALVPFLLFFGVVGMVAIVRWLFNV